MDEDAGSQTVTDWVTEASPGPDDESSQPIIFNVSTDNEGLFSEKPSIDASGSLTYTPAPDANGIANIFVTLEDNGGVENSGADTSQEQIFVITVNGINDAPFFTIGPDVIVNEDAGPQTVSSWATGISAGAENESGQTLDFVVSTDNETLFSEKPSITDSGVLTYTPGPDVNGSSNITLTLKDDGGIESNGADVSSEQTFILTVNAVNDAPSFTKGTDITVDEDAAPQTVSNWATGISAGPDESDQTLIFEVTSYDESLFSEGPTLDASGTLSFTPGPNANGTTPVAVILKDNGGSENDNTDTSPVQRFTITLSPVNDAPVANDDIYTVNEDGTLTITAPGVLENDSDIEGDPLTAVKISDPSEGLLTLNSDGSFTYTPAPDFNGKDSFSYRASDGPDRSDDVTVTISVRSVNDPPGANNDNYTVNEDDTLTIAGPGVLENDTDLEGSSLEAVKAGDPSEGSLALNSDGSFTYTPNPDFSGKDSFSYIAADESDAAVISGEAIVTITVSAFNDAPVLDDSSFMSLGQINEDAADDENIGSLISEIIADNGTITDADVGAAKGMAVSTTDNIGGIWQYDKEGKGIFINFPEDIAEENAVLLNETAVIRFLPDADFNGISEITFRAWDQTFGENGDTGIDVTANGGETAFSTNIGTATITVAELNDSPTISGTPTDRVDEDTLYLFVPISDDREHDSLTFSVTNPPSWAAFDTSTGELIGTPGDKDPGTTQDIVISVSDGTETASLPPFNITVVNINDAPIISGTPHISADEDVRYSFTPTVEDVDSEDILTFSVENKPEWANFNTETGELSGIPENSHVGTSEDILISVSDRTEIVSLPMFDITVSNTNDAPEISGTPQTSTDEDSAYSFTPTVADPDVGDELTFSVENKPDWANFNTDTGELSGIPENSHVGTTGDIVISVSDGSETISLPGFSITVVSTNDAPVISGDPITSIGENSFYSFAPTVEDADTGDTLTFSIENKPGWALFDPATGELSGLPTFDIAVINTDILPVITAQNALTTYKETSLSISLNDLSVSDSDNIFPDDFTLTVQEGDRYAREENTVTPEADFTGTLTVPVMVNDGTYNSDVFYLSIAVIGLNGPIISGQEALSVFGESPLTIILAYLKVTDPDDTYPGDFTLTVQDGENYTREEDTIIPIPGFVSTLTVPVKVNDGTSDSNLFDLQITVIPATDEMHEISGVISGLEKDRDLRINVLSRSLSFSQIIDIKGTGEDMDYSVTDLNPASDYKVELNSADYAYQAYDNRDDLEDADFINLSYNDADEIHFALLPPDAVISGTVIFPDDALPGDTARVNVFSSSTGSTADVRVEFQDDPEVLYEITGLFPADDYAVSVWPDSYKSRYHDGSSQESGTKDEEDATLLDTDSSEAGEVTFRLEKGASVSGGISGDASGGTSGEAAEELFVEVWGSDGSSKSGTIAPDGTLMVEGLEEMGEFYIVVHKPGVAPFFYSEEGTVRDISLATPIRAEDGFPEDIDIEVTKGETLVGTVLDENGSPISGVWVEAWSGSQGTGFGGAYTREDGTYEIKGVPPGEAPEIIARPDSSLHYTTEEGTGVSEEGGGTTLQLGVREVYKIEGSVKDENGALIPNVEVEITSDSQNFHGRNTYPPGTEGLYIAAPYSISGLPPADDYVITARPPSDSGYAVFTEVGISIHEDTAKDIILPRGASINGEIQGKADEDVKGVRVILVSEEKNFRMEVITDENGFYEITNIPEASDYVITLVSESFTSQEKNIDISSQGDGDIDIDIITLEPGGGITGQITDKITGSLLPGVLVEAYSENMGDMPNYGGVAVTDEQGRYAIEGLQTEDQDGNRINDYTVVVNAAEYPLHSETGKTPGNEVIDFLLDPGEPIYGTVSGVDSDADAVVADIFEKDGDFIKSVTCEPDGSFDTGGLSSARQYELRFTAFLSNGRDMTQWAGEGDIGFDDPDPYGDSNPKDAKVFDAGDTVNLRFGETAGRARYSGSESRSSRSEDALELTSADSGFVSANPEVTVKWESSSTDPYEKYYYVFNKNSGHVMTKRNAPPVRPIRIRRATSQNLTGDNVSYHFHVAPVNQRGRIGTTETIGFRIDTVPPANATAIAPKFTTSRYVMLTLGVTGASEMYLSNTNYGEGGKWEQWSKAREWKLTSSQGVKKIYVQFRDRAGNTANVLTVTELLESMPDQYKITATAGENGRIVPSGDVMVWTGDDRKFVIMPDEGYETDEVLADGELATLTDGNAHTFQNVARDASISVTFRAKATVTYTITASAGANGIMTPSGTVTVSEGDDILFAVTPDDGYEPDIMLLDGKRVGLTADSTFRFINVSKDYELSASFKTKSGN